MSKIKNIYKIGIDVATNKTGIGFFVGNDKKPAGAVLVISNEDGGVFRGDKVSQDTINIQNEAKRLADAVKAHIIRKYGVIGKDQQEKWNKAILESKVYVAIEVSNHANKSLAMKLGVYAGVYAGLFAYEFAKIGFSFIRDNFTIKFVNPNEWKLRAFGTSPDRELAKITAIKYCNEKFYDGEEQFKIDKIGKGEDDIADALIIASLAMVLRDNMFVGQARHIRKTTKENNKAKISTIEGKVKNLAQKLLTKKEKEISRINMLKKWNINPTKYKTKAAFDKRQTILTEGKMDALKEANKPLWEYANTSQKERLLRYKNELLELKANLDTIRDFGIKGETNE